MGFMFASIRAKLIVILLSLGVFPLLIVGYLAYENASDALLFQAKEQLGNIGEKTAQQIDDFFLELNKDIELLSEYPFIQLAFLQFEFGQRLDTVQRVLIDYRNKNNNFNGIYLVDLNGKAIISENESDQVFGKSYFEEWMKRTFSKGLYLSEIVTSNNGQMPKIILSKPVYDFEDSQKKVGLLVFDIKLSSFTRFVSPLKIGEDGFAFLWDHNGYALYHPDRSYLFNLQIGEKGDDDFRGLLERMSEKEKGFGNYSLKGVEKNMFFTPCHTPDWSVAITIETSKLMGDILKLRRSMITFISIIGMLIICVSFLFVKSITRPIKSLTEGARALGNGNLEHVITIDSDDEFFRLAQEFNSMSYRLRQSMNEIIELKTFNDDILRSVTSGIITVDRVNKITSFNKVAGRIIRLTKEDTSSTQSPQIEKIKSILHTTLTDNASATNMELEFYSKRNERLSFMELNTSLLRNASGKVIGAIADIRDITHRKKIEGEMIRVEKLASLGELSAGMAHEIRNPLAGMKTSAQVLSKRLKTDSGKILLDGIIESIDRMNNTVTDLLNFSRPKPSCLKPFDIPKLIDLSLTMLRVNLKKFNIDLVLDYEKSLPKALIDKEQIQQVCINLILNALKAMPHGGTFNITVKNGRPPIQDFLKISFTDTGSGIKKEHLSKIFNPFFTCDPKGTGLGLSIVQKLLEENHGCIQIDSMEGKGTKAVINLPVVQKD